MEAILVAGISAFAEVISAKQFGQLGIIWTPQMAFRTFREESPKPETDVEPPVEELSPQERSRPKSST
ncbi:hypothetical protein [Nonomuraea sp. WAC 01424]|uniref:hypothetical protein n=1 Tax=Nonomuraea sp. WAC 01424 TaxID=2203200 RepID=UPI000F794984|nr:hypothetical protein [Nonomuraea sp. WAC 01424]